MSELTGTSKSEAYKTYARSLIEAKDHGKPIPRLTVDNPKLTGEDGYKILEEYVRLRQSAGFRVIGYKLAYTSEAMRTQMGIPEPSYGLLFDDQWGKYRNEIPWSNLIHPKIEPEMGLVMKEDVPDIPKDKNWLPFIEKMFPVIEFVDSRYVNYKFENPDIIADNNSAAFNLVGGEFLVDEGQWQNHFQVDLYKNGELTEQGSTENVMGHPFLALEWLVKKLKEHGKNLKKGDIVITGGITKAMDVSKDDQVKVVFKGIGDIDF